MAGKMQQRRIGEEKGKVRERGRPGINYEPQTLEEVKFFLDAIKYPSMRDRILFVAELKPELLKIKHRLLADLLGTSRETVTRELSKLRKSNLYE